MHGTVALINADDALVAVETEHEEYTVMGVLDEEALAVGDTVEGDLERLDYQVLDNTTKGTQVAVYIEDTELTVDQAKEKMDLT
ncbi:MAG: hypothetical protein R6V11_04205 [Ectothiorhodospiraceae bacterium]